MMWLINLSIPIVLSVGGTLINYMFRSEIPFVEWARAYQEFKYEWATNGFMHNDDHVVAYLMFDLIVAFVLMFVSLWLLEQSVIVWFIIAIPFIVRFITGLIKK
ncbi:hypothetical protein PVA23_53 [Vibrio phage PVA23]|nr:hypothetical protein PVA23_53 [Vibrio phage PVA23]